ncbi:hypothetical protein MKW92_033786, partial [Papaver armeniacum]
GSLWNISGEPCSGAAIDRTGIEDNPNFNLGSNAVAEPLIDPLATLLNCMLLLYNAFTGNIPDFIGTWSKLISLRFEGNSFEGPIPASLSNLTLLDDLRISGLSNISSSLDFIKDLKNLSILFLRNNLISGSIPSNMGEYRKLRRLDLSFNNLTGRIPEDLFNLSSLGISGNNSLSGIIPSEISYAPALDLSYNELSGSLPDWVTQRNRQVNLVANNFSEDIFRDSVPESLRICPQRDFTCNGDPPRTSTSAINCGGRMMRSSDGIDFEADDSALGEASLRFTNYRRWAISNVGLFGEIVRARDILTTLSQITGTLDWAVSDIQDIRRDQLRFYSLGLENGMYNVNLRFAETEYDDPSSLTWKSLGRRVFNIYLQACKDFDIRKEAGGASNRAVQRDLRFRYLRITLRFIFLGRERTCCIPYQGSYGPSISAILITPDFEPTVSKLPPTAPEKSKTGLIVGIVVSVAVLSCISIFAVFYCGRKVSDVDEEEELLGIENKPNTFTYVELRNATAAFNSANKLGEGGFGSVYKGANRLLVYEYLEHRSLDQRISCPEYALLGHLTEKADIFGFGVVALRLSAWSLHENGRTLELVDPSLTDFDNGEAMRMIGIAFLCTQASPVLRPAMSRVVGMLSGDIEVSTVTSRPNYIRGFFSYTPISYCLF